MEQRQQPEEVEDQERRSKTAAERWEELEGAFERSLTAVVVGCGQRGQTYASYALDFPRRLKIVAVAEPKRHVLEKMKNLYGLRERQLFADWKDLAACDRLADVAIVATQDRMHLESATAMARKGYHLLLEKPMSVSEVECEEMARVFRECNVMVAVCHVLRYFPPCRQIRALIDSGVLGEIVSLDHRENILHWHFAHSFVRGNWRREDESAFSLLAKSCHDLDLITFWMGDRKCTKVQSFGRLQHFVKDQAPEGAAKRCVECPERVERGCPYSAKKIYLEAYDGGAPRWPMSVVCDVEDVPAGRYANALTEALKEGPYGRCVYDCDNDVVDHQVVQMEYDCGATVSFVMNAFTHDMRRETRICGTRGELRWDGSESGGITVHDFAKRTVSPEHPDAVVAPQVLLRGHGGADFFLVNDFVKAVAAQDHAAVSSGFETALRSHKLVFAAERSRLKNQVVSTAHI